MALNLLWFAPLPTILVGKALDLPGLSSVEARRTLSSDQQFEDLCSGTADAVVTAIDNVVTWNERASCARFRAIAQVELTTELVLVAQPDIAAIENLAGATLLVDSSTNGFVVALRAMLLAAGIDDRQCTLDPAGGVTERLAALLAGRGAATLLGSPFHHTAIAQGCQVVGHVQSLWPEFPGQGLVIDTNRLDPARKDNLFPGIAALIGAMEVARQAILADREAAIGILDRQGIPTKAAAGMLDSVPHSWIPDAAGIDCLIRHRAMVWPERPALLRGDLVDESMALAMNSLNTKG